jgi:hypothetical protein
MGSGGGGGQKGAYVRKEYYYLTKVKARVWCSVVEP